MASSDKQRAKGILRTRMLHRMASVSAPEAKAAGQSIATQLAQCRSWPELEVVALFASLRGEVDTLPVIELCWSAGKQVLLPRVLGGRRLEFAICEPGEPLISGPLGVREPGEGATVSALDEADQVLVPGVAFDRGGGRLGRGRGYYDRALAGLQGGSRRPLLTGIAFAFQVVEGVPVDPLDVRVDEILTEVDGSPVSRTLGDFR